MKEYSRAPERANQNTSRDPRASKQTSMSDYLTAQRKELLPSETDGAIQLAGGKKHHAPTKKKYISKEMAESQVYIASKQMDFIKSGERNRREAKRKAKTELKKEEPKKEEPKKEEPKKEEPKKEEPKKEE